MLRHLMVHFRMGIKLPSIAENFDPADWMRTHYSEDSVSCGAQFASVLTKTIKDIMTMNNLQRNTARMACWTNHSGTTVFLI